MLSGLDLREVELSLSSVVSRIVQSRASFCGGGTVYSLWSFPIQIEIKMLLIFVIII